MFFGKRCGRMDEQSSEGDGDGLTDLQREEVTLTKIENKSGPILRMVMNLNEFYDYALK